MTDDYKTPAVVQGQIHRGDFLGVRASQLAQQGDREAFTWYSVIITCDGVEVAIGSASEKAVRAAVKDVKVGESVELSTYTKVTGKGALSVRLAGAASENGGRGDWMTL